MVVPSLPPRGGKADAAAAAAAAAAAKPSAEAAPVSTEERVDAAPAAAAAVLGDLMPGDEEARPTLRWEKRWGLWRKNSVCIVANLWAHMDVTLSSGATLEDLRKDVLKHLDLALPEKNSILFDMVDDFEEKQQISIGLVTSSRVCKQLKQEWRQKPMCEGKATVTWTETVDTSSEAYLASIRALWNPNKIRIDTLCLDMPSRWFFGKDQSTWPPGHSAQIPRMAHWFKFAQLFGPVERVELAWRSRGGLTVSLLAQFSASAYVRAAYELLIGRSLYNPLTSQKMDATAVKASFGEFRELVEKAQKTLEAPSLLQASRPAKIPAPLPDPPPDGPRGPIFEVGPLRPGESQDALARICLAPWRPRAVLGRMSWCDLQIASHFVSKHHADLSIMGQVSNGTADASSLSGLELFITDRSTNGTFVNGSRVAKSSMHVLRAGDQISFTDAIDPSAPTFIVRHFQNFDDQPKAATIEPEHDKMKMFAVPTVPSFKQIPQKARHREVAAGNTVLKVAEFPDVVPEKSAKRQKHE